MVSNSDQSRGNDILNPPNESGPSTNSSISDTSVGAQMETDNIPEDEPDIDDGYATNSGGSGFMSMTSSILNHVFEDGRRYHRYHAGKYVLPNDQSEQERETLNHEMIVLVCGGKLHLAPIGDHPQNIIDLGTGIGSWAIEMADKYASASVIGADLSPIQLTWVPPNAEFIIDDISEDWEYTHNYFDLVHFRHVIAYVHNIPEVFKKAYLATKPGGWIEIQEYEDLPSCDDGSMPDNYPVCEFFRHVAQGIAVFGGDSSATLKAKDYLEAAGFFNITDKVYKIPIGPWARDNDLKEIGIAMQKILLGGLSAFSLKTLGTGLGWSTERIEETLVDVRNTLMDSKVHSFWRFHIITAQKA